MAPAPGRWWFERPPSMMLNGHGTRSGTPPPRHEHFRGRDARRSGSRRAGLDHRSGAARDQPPERARARLAGALHGLLRHGDDPVLPGLLPGGAAQAVRRAALALASGSRSGPARARSRRPAGGSAGDRCSGGSSGSPGGSPARGPAGRGTAGAAWDGTTVDLADEPEIEAAFGRRRGGLSADAPVHPDRNRDAGRLRPGRRPAGDRRGGTGARAARPARARHAVPGRPRPGRLWRDAAATGADLLWRVRSNQKFPCRRRLPDGSFLSEMKVDSTAPGAGTVPVRVIEYPLKGVPGAEPVYRLITTILDAQAAPALAALYHERWEAETTLCEIKVRLPGRRLMLRSRSVELVWQELYGLALTHFALRDLMHEAALVGDCDVDTLSFTNTVKIVQSHVVLQGSFPPCASSRHPDEDHPRDPALPG